MPPNWTAAYQRALDFLYSRINYERVVETPYSRREYRLARMRELLARLDQPQDALRIVHVAGTKGKGSTAAMIAAILSAAGYRAGLFSSPHLNRVEERVSVCGENCTEEQFTALIERLRPVVESMDRAAAAREAIGPTYFEITTAAALIHFAANKLDAAVLEVGMGGRLDSTNVCLPVVSVITSISFDHMKQLGNTLAAIAREKAGIIKPGIPVVSGVQDDEPRQVIESVRRERGCPIAQLGVDFNFQYRPPKDLDRGEDAAEMHFHQPLRPRAAEYRDLKLRLIGRHQAANAAVAVATVETLIGQGWIVPEAAIRQGLLDVRWPARVELIARRPALVIDAAHNVASIESFVQTIEESFSARRRWLIFATSQDKQVPEMLARLLPRFHGVILTRYLNNPRAVPVDELAEMAHRLISQGVVERPERLPIIAADPAAAWKLAAELAAEDDLICVTGSFFLAAELRVLAGITT